MSSRKRDDLTGYLFRVVQRPAGSDDEWEHSDCGHYGRPRTYMTLGAARGQKSQAEASWNRYYSDWSRMQEATPPPRPRAEFAVQRAPVTDWEVVPDGLV